jgi:HK97 gp10 family phage protein
MAKETFTFKAEGFKELHDLLIEMGDDLCYGKTAKRVLIPAVKAAMKPVADQVKATIPYDEKNNSGKHMKDTVRISGRVPNSRDMRAQHADPDAIAVGIVSIKTDDRGMSQEFGNARVPAQPFMRRALEGQANRVINILGTYLAYKLDHYKSKKG